MNDDPKHDGLPDGDQTTECAQCKGEKGCCQTVATIPADELLVAIIESRLATKH